VVKSRFCVSRFARFMAAISIAYCFSLFFELFLSAFRQAGKWFLHCYLTHVLVYRVFFGLAQATESYLRYLVVHAAGLLSSLLGVWWASVTHPDACQLFFGENVALSVFVWWLYKLFVT
jgi:hypothetical protein